MSEEVEEAIATVVTAYMYATNGLSKKEERWVARGMAVFASSMMTQLDAQLADPDGE